MDELEISGKRYISAARAAKEYQYHSDYIGQLIRSKKVLGQKVGRAWYVDADSLAEYLGKEVPPRGPVVKKEKTVEDAVLEQKISDLIVEERKEVSVEERMEEVIAKVENGGSGEKSVAELVEVRDISPDLTEDKSESAEASFIMPLRKSARSHIVAAIDETPAAQEVEEKQTPPAEEKISIQKEPEAIEEEIKEEENFIPLKISKESVHDLYAEPEDSFYKVSRKGLHYVKPSTHKELLQEARTIPATPRTAVKEKRSQRLSRGATAAVSFILVAGIVSLGAGVLMSYYLHSITTVKDSSQTSSVILSN